MEENTQVDTGKYNSLGRTSQRLLYLAGKAADYFIIILEGRVRVTVGNEGLVFESGPFTHFGVAALKNPDESVKRASSRQSVVSSLLQPEPVRPPSPEMKKSPSGSAKFPTSEVNTPTGAFIPDYTVKCVETTLYMKIPRRVYLAAIRATLMERQKGVLSPDEDDECVKELDHIFSNSANFNRRSYPGLNHRESLVSTQSHLAGTILGSGGGTAYQLKKRKSTESSCSQPRNLNVFNNLESAPSLDHNNHSNSNLMMESGFVNDLSECTIEQARRDETRILLNPSPSHSLGEARSLDETSTRIVFPDNQPPSPSLSLKESSPNEKSFLV